jgi:hypothetical protein
MKEQQWRQTSLHPISKMPFKGACSLQPRDATIKYRTLLIHHHIKIFFSRNSKYLFQTHPAASKLKTLERKLKRNPSMMTIFCKVSKLLKIKILI